MTVTKSQKSPVTLSCSGFSLTLVVQIENLLKGIDYTVVMNTFFSKEISTSFFPLRMKYHIL